MNEEQIEQMLRNQRKANSSLSSIRNWVAFFGVIVVISLIIAVIGFLFSAAALI